jgi:uncharacterized protein with HEPN domain
LKSDRPYLLHILDAIGRIEAYTGEGHDRFLLDVRTQDAILRNLEVIGEAVKSLSDALKAQYPDIAWRRIAGMRDRLIHQYFKVSLELVWNVSTEHLHGLRQAINDALMKLERESCT